MLSTVYHAGLPRIERYFQPQSVQECASLLTVHASPGKTFVMAGGTDLLVSLRRQYLPTTTIIDMCQIEELRRVTFGANGLRIGALATLREVEQTPAVRERFPALHESLRLMSSTQIRNQGTVVGNVCRASPAGDAIPPLLACAARVQLVSAHGNREMSLEEFIVGPGQTVLAPDEIVTEVRVPTPPPGTGSAFMRLTRVAFDLSKVNVAVVLQVRNGVCQDARIVLGAVGPTCIRARRAEQMLAGRRLDDGIVQEAAKTVATEIAPITDQRSTAEYRSKMAVVLVKRAVAQAARGVRES